MEQADPLDPQDVAGDFDISMPCTFKLAIRDLQHAKPGNDAIAHAGAEDDAGNVREHAGCETHGTGLARGVHRAARKVEAARLPAGFRDGVGLGVGDDAGILEDRVMGNADYLAVPDYGRPKGKLSLADAFPGLCDSDAYVLFVCQNRRR